MTLYRVAGGNDGEGSFAGFYREADGTLRHLTGAEYGAYEAGGNVAKDVTQDQFAGVLSGSTVRKTSGALPNGYLSDANQTAWNGKTPAAKTAAATPVASPETTNLLARFGVDYQNAPALSPANMAFMRGIGLSLDTAADMKAKAVGRLKDRSTTAMGDIDRGNDRTKTNMLADLVRRGVLRSGESDKRYGEQAENVASQKSGVMRSEADGIAAADDSYNTARDGYRTQALERIIGTETDQAREAATATAVADGYEREDAAAETAATRLKEADEARALQNEELIRKYGVPR